MSQSGSSGYPFKTPHQYPFDYDDQVGDQSKSSCSFQADTPTERSCAFRSFCTVASNVCSAYSGLDNFKISIVFL